MITPQSLLRVVIEMIFVLLGALVVWLGLTGRIFFDPRSGSQIPGLFLIVWGLIALFKPAPRWEQWTRGLSMTLLGIVMLIISRVPYFWVGRLFVVAGLLLVMRGLIESFLVLRPR